MSENTTALRRLLNAARPFKSFKLDIDGRIFDGYVRKASLAEGQEIASIWDKVYNETMAGVYEGTKDIGLLVLFENLKHQKKNTLVKYIIIAEEQDFFAEADALLGGDVKHDSIVFKDELDKIKKSREEELHALKPEELLQLAMERRAHYYAISLANEAMTRKVAQLTVFDEDKNPFFQSEEEVKELPGPILQQLIKATTEALAEDLKDVNPLNSRRRVRSEKPSPSQKNLVVE